jgi:hypothetical protein
MGFYSLGSVPPVAHSEIGKKQLMRVPYRSLYLSLLPWVEGSLVRNDYHLHCVIKAELLSTAVYILATGWLVSSVILKPIIELTRFWPSRSFIGLQSDKADVNTIRSIIYYKYVMYLGLYCAFVNPSP